MRFCVYQPGSTSRTRFGRRLGNANSPDNTVIAMMTMVVEQAQTDAKPRQSEPANTSKDDANSSRADGATQDEKGSATDPKTGRAVPSGKTQAGKSDKADAKVEGESAGETEANQAVEQWLRQVPDDPGALLRRKFEYEAAQRAAGENR